MQQVCTDGLDQLPTDPPIAEDDDFMCDAVWGGWSCTARAGHHGPHIATGTTDVIYARWDKS